MCSSVFHLHKVAANAPPQMSSARATTLRRPRGQRRETLRFRSVIEGFSELGFIKFCLVNLPGVSFVALLDLGIFGAERNKLMQTPEYSFL